jgi:hypothetical protein
MYNNQQYNTIRVGDNVVFAAPSGRTYEAIVLETDWISHEVNLLVEFSFTWNNRIIKSTGWQPFSSIRQPAKDVCPACGDHFYLSIVGDLDTPCPICNPVELEVIF